ncbi:aminomethyltransferase family protein [Desulfomonile tiedjei]|uniref:Glycine cleavage system T protein (Aminomethyltransferase) n=1 Tax=Desulfomonile tiedjei (strain ATCC 49306 / DSM 6799 / DCB-1) TaxID=706587 RepID=I4C3N2_DESTA|nr:glycine cleavage system T protein (aminomethyltransferase) [Desulfomonile tiedjei]AFM24173.1 glycine cleavage system T protein (aminomethyltransferase) [Desulfomonile tiedjei DSM 6799]
MNTSRKTLLHAWHLARGAHMAEFAGWEMPLWYPTGAVAEHRAVVTAAGLFDTSHMDALTVAGGDAFDLLQECFTRDLRSCVGKGKLPLSEGACVYGAFLTEEGWVIDDAVVYRTGPEAFFIVVNAGMGPKITDHLQSRLRERKVTVSDVSRSIAKMDLQGPDSARILMRILESPENVLTNFQYFTFRGSYDESGFSGPKFRKTQAPVLVSRTGYSGELGFELLVSPERLLDAWEEILEPGGDLPLIACGLAARDSLRTGAMLPLSHQDIGSWMFINHPWEFALPFNEDRSGFTKRFVGDCVLNARGSSDFTYAFAGFDPRKVSAGERSIVLDEAENEIGIVLTCVSDMAINRVNERIYSMASPGKPDGFKPLGLNCGFVKVRVRLPTGATIYLRDQRRTIKAQIIDEIRPDRTARRSINRML